MQEWPSEVISLSHTHPQTHTCTGENSEDESPNDRRAMVTAVKMFAADSDHSSETKNED